MLGFINLLYAIPMFLLFIVTVKILSLRRVVETNQVHIVQSRKKTLSYGKDRESGNVYYHWPKWVPFIGMELIVLPVSNFDLSLDAYPAYDQDRVPFKVDVTAFFRIEDTNVAAQRVASVGELNAQLLAIIQGAIRSILAAHVIDDIMMKRDTFGDAFTKAVEPELKNWGVIPVKNLELMDIRDDDGSQVIHNIMAKKKSHIEMESRVEVAKNTKLAETAEVEAKREVDLRVVEATQQVGERTAESDKQVGVANEQAKQEIKVQQAVTAEKDMGVIKVNTLRQADINKEQAEIGLGEADFRAKAVLKAGTAEADVRKKLFEADNALELKLTVQRDTSIGVAKALGEAGISLVPEIFFGGSSGESEGAPDNAVNTLMKITSVLAAKQTVGETEVKAREAQPESNNVAH